MYQRKRRKNTITVRRTWPGSVIALAMGAVVCAGLTIANDWTGSDRAVSPPVLVTTSIASEQSDSIREPRKEPQALQWEDPCPWDFNGDGKVDGADLGALLANWGDCEECDDCPWDFNDDCVVDGADLGALLANWGDCPEPPPPLCDYQYDTETTNGAVGLPQHGVIVWLHRFELPDEIDMVWAIQTTFGMPGQPSGVNAGDPVGFVVYDVNEDGSPGELLFADTCTIDEDAIETGQKQVLTVPGIPVADEFYIGIYVEDPGLNYFPAPVDPTVTDQEDNVWVAADFVSFGDFDPASDPSGWSIPPNTLISFGIEGVWVTCGSGLAEVAPDDDGILFEIEDNAVAPLFGEYIKRAHGDEASERGDLFVSHGETLSGRVVAENIYMEDGGRVYIAPGTTIIATGDIWLGAALVPLLDDRPQTRRSNEVERASVPSQAWCVDCDGVPTPEQGANGANASIIRFTFAGTMTIPNDFAFGDICTGEAGAGGDGEDAEDEAEPNENAWAIGGNGGRGASVLFRGGTLNVNGLICSGRGGNGGDAFAMAGPQLEDCACGCDARAEGGNGGRPGGLLISVIELNFGAGGRVKIAPCDDEHGDEDACRRGGEAEAVASDGSWCFGCPEPHAERGGWAVATGGDASSPRRFCLSARNWNMPGGGGQSEFMQSFFELPAGPEGGDAYAFAGNGGDADLCDCNWDANHGGDGGDATATGGRAGRGYSTIGGSGQPCRVMQVQRAAGTDGGPGGNAEAFAGSGGIGGWAGPCGCQQGPAGDGGEGGDGGDATATGGRGGAASLRRYVSVPDGYIPTSGDGGDATVWCGSSGDGGDGGDCIDDSTGIPCDPGDGGWTGVRGANNATPGLPGQRKGSANRGDPGNTTTLDCFTGSDGADGADGCP